MTGVTRQRARPQSLAPGYPSRHPDPKARTRQWRRTFPSSQRKGQTLGGHRHLQGCIPGQRKHRGEAEAVAFVSVSFVTWDFLISPSKPNDWGTPRESLRDGGLVGDSRSSVSLAAEVSMNTHCLPLKASEARDVLQQPVTRGHCTRRGTHG